MKNVFAFFHWIAWGIRKAVFYVPTRGAIIGLRFIGNGISEAFSHLFRKG